jgi:16S rRNA (cytosine967-C5)-methyltransferase
MKHFSHVNTATRILNEYKGAQPFGIFIKEFFRSDKKFGSRDRKQISHLCYCYFRLGKAAITVPVQERILLALFLCSSAPNDLLQETKPEWNDIVHLPVGEKITASGYSFAVNEIFHFNEDLSEGIESYEFAASHLRQPDLFLRMRPGYELEVENKLRISGFNYDRVSLACVALPNGTKIETSITVNKEAVVQDLNSQRVGELMLLAAGGHQADNTRQLKLWDCCAASGGKSIMAADILGDIQLDVSDIRESILINLRKRFAEAGMTNFKSFVCDLSFPHIPLKHLEYYDLVIADVPCTGSGTWGRTPEQLFYFHEKKVREYASLQQTIALNVIPAIKKGGYLLYITCSVFKKENEETIGYIQQHSGLQLKAMELFTGYNKKADTLFAALLQQPL